MIPWGSASASLSSDRNVRYFSEARGQKDLHAREVTGQSPARTPMLPGPGRNPTRATGSSSFHGYELSMIPVDGRAMAPGQERRDDLPPGIERQRMGAAFGRDSLVAA